MLHIYRIPGPCDLQSLQRIQKVTSKVTHVRTEYCFNVEHAVSDTSLEKLVWLLAEPHLPLQSRPHSSFLTANEPDIVILEVGPRLAFQTGNTTNKKSPCLALALALTLTPTATTTLPSLGFELRKYLLRMWHKRREN